MLNLVPSMIYSPKSSQSLPPIYLCMLLLRRYFHWHWLTTISHISTIVLPLIYSRLILKNENDALKVLQKLSNEPVAVGSLPHIHTLGIHLLSGWHYDVHFQAVEGFGQLSSVFWEELKKNCPRVRGLILRNIADSYQEPWLDTSGLLEIQDITSLTLDFWTNALNKEKLLKNIASLCGALHTLDLAPHTGCGVSATPLFSLQFPHLRLLSLGSLSVENPDEGMGFWARHPALENLRIISNDPNNRWFTNELPGDFLPNLKHLKANFNDVRAVAPILHQLVSLAIYRSVNAQIPYLLRCVLPQGLPNLKSLSIQQKASGSGKNVNVEGNQWYETEDGKFMEAQVQKGSRSVFSGYMHSIVRGAPNLQEIRFIVGGSLSGFADIAPEIAGLSKLRRFYHTGNNVSLSDMTYEECSALVSDTQILAEACGELTAVVDTGSVNLPYVTARISRDDDGRFIKIDLGTGYGMHFGNDDEAFPGR